MQLRIPRLVIAMSLLHAAAVLGADREPPRRDALLRPALDAVDAPTPGERHRQRAWALAHLYEIERVREAPGGRDPLRRVVQSAANEDQRRIAALLGEIRQDKGKAPPPGDAGQPQRVAFLEFGTPAAAGTPPRNESVGWEIRATA